MKAVIAWRWVKQPGDLTSIKTGVERHRQSKWQPTGNLHIQPDDPRFGVEHMDDAIRGHPPVFGTSIKNVWIVRRDLLDGSYPVRQLRPIASLLRRSQPLIRRQ